MEIASVNKYLEELGMTLGSVESFTGGLFASSITSVGGASKVFKGSYITYATEEKIKLLQIPENIIQQFGVVSKEVAYYMANNGRQLLNVDVCVSFTGNAGPSVMENKEVGEVYLAISYKNIEVYAYHLKGDRHQIQEAAIKLMCENLYKKIK